MTLTRVLRDKSWRAKIPASDALFGLIGETVASLRVREASALVMPQLTVDEIFTGRPGALPRWLPAALPQLHRIADPSAGGAVKPAPHVPHEHGPEA